VCVTSHVANTVSHVGGNNLVTRHDAMSFLEKEHYYKIRYLSGKKNTI